MNIIGADISLKHGALVSINFDSVLVNKIPILPSNVQICTYDFSKSSFDKIGTIQNIAKVIKNDFRHILIGCNHLFIEGGSFKSPGNVYHLGMAAGAVVAALSNFNELKVTEISPQRWKSIMLLERPPKGIKSKVENYIKFMTDNLIQSYVDYETIKSIISRYSLNVAADILDALAVGVAGLVMEGDWHGIKCS